MRKITNKLKSNKGFTMQDAALAIIIIILFAGTIGASFVSVYRVQAETKLSAVATLYAVQIMEYTDYISYAEVVPDVERRTFSK